MKNILKKVVWTVLTISNVTLSCMVFSCNLPIPLVSEVYAGNETLLDYNIVTKVDSNDLRSLKTTLFGGDVLSHPDGLSKIGGNTSGSKKTFPQIIYQVDMGNEADSSQADAGDTVKFSVGNSLILNDKGFFVTAYHCVENFGKEKIGRSQNFLMMYGPMRNMVMKGRILSFSEKYDIALGQVDLPDDIHMDDVRITQSVVEPSQVLYAKRFSNLDYIKNDLLANMLFPEAPDMSKESDMLSVFMREPDPNWRRKLGLEVCVGYTVGLKNQAGLTIAGPKSGQYFLMTGNQPTVEGHSGSPIYAGNGDLAGIVVEIPTSDTLITNASGEAVRITYFTGPEKIRELIGNYIEVCTGVENRT